MKVTHVGYNEIVQEDEVNDVDVRFERMEVSDFPYESTYRVTLFGFIGNSPCKFGYKFTREFIDTPTLTDEQKKSIIVDVFKRHARKVLDST